MNKLTKILMGKALAAASILMLAMPGLSFATTHLISINPTGSISLGAPGSIIVPLGGAGGTYALTSPLVINGLENNKSTSFSGSLTTIKAHVYICSGTEWIDQGDVTIGVYGTLSDGPATLTIPQSSFSAPSQSGSCTSKGVTNVSGLTYNASVKQNNGQTPINTTYNYWNDPSVVPEPGTLALMLTALLGLVWFSRKRMPGSAT